MPTPSKPASTPKTKPDKIAAVAANASHKTGDGAKPQRVAAKPAAAAKPKTDAKPAAVGKPAARAKSTPAAKGATRAKAAAKPVAAHPTTAEPAITAAPAGAPSAGTAAPAATATRVAPTATAVPPAPSAPADAKSPRAPREGTAMHAALTILRQADGPLTPTEIFDRASKAGLTKNLKGKTPIATLGAQLAVANKNGRHVERAAPGRYQART
ncbi:winged helix-turn-helix domain-containing protein [Paraconexibacter antarcticus]|uniref:Winged helix-turn-helix domain-containing protein n=1 Tax=Paraconexibacter antarcticus TaxID=2949664 RepID=A0ABY5DQM8_9ACTN|nr:winged helix-turn-helix domain-containing protein [Paraconexibacter antarcticus]UTI63919.1 winged helix-turn-helix domain-containing protein [Paraconexibacter antarcticus]